MRRALKYIGLGLLAIVVIAVLAFEWEQLTGEDTHFTSSIAHLLFHNNLHAVVEGKVYRSAEMPAADLEKVIREKGIKTVLDVRLGKDEGEFDGGAEAETVKSAGAHYVHFPLRGSRVPTAERVESLMETLDSVQTPVLVHCTSGTHRSGVVSAIWLMEKEGVAPEIAAKQLTSEYGFFRRERDLKSLVQGHPTIDHLIWMYLEKSRETNESFRDWLKRRTS